MQQPKEDKELVYQMELVQYLVVVIENHHHHTFLM